MTLEIFQKFIDEQDALFRAVKDSNKTDRERVFARVIKLGEEYGELCDEVLASVGDQRKDKLDEKHDLEGEFADVVIVAFMLAKAMNIDMKKALINKMQKIKDKHNKQIGVK
ncbi:MAG: MazG nucleotide pyrophosphohydrolase domain-containing protein [Patescibacteria group bacterium]